MAVVVTCEEKDVEWAENIRIRQTFQLWKFGSPQIFEHVETYVIYLEDGSLLLPFQTLAQCMKIIWVAVYVALC